MSVREPDSRNPALLRLAQAHGVLTEHENGMGVWCLPSEAALTAVLRALGVDIEEPADAERIESLTPGQPVKTFWRDDERKLGVFGPLYAVRSGRGGGVGDLEDLARLCEWAGGLGASLVSTLPLLAGRYATPIDGCPYAPVSRSVFSELFLDLTSAMIDGERAEAERLGQASLIDYEASWNLKRCVLEREAANADAAAVEAFLSRDPLIAQYAKWRALESGDPSKERLYGYAQMLLHQQLSSVRNRAEAAGCGLYLDLPVGVVASGFDVHRQPDLYAKGVAVGAPPDAYFPEGQVWGFPPMIPERVRLGGHVELAEATRRHLRYASTLRLDHVMGLWRLYWIPEGHGADDGVYVRYDAGGALDVLADLSHEHQATFIGENLGTVPPEVDAAMIERKLMGMTAAQYDGGDQAMAPGAAKHELLAAANTHDMPTFAGYLEGRDIDLRRALRLLDKSSAKYDARLREAAVERLHETLGVRGEGELFDALMNRLCGSPAPVVMLALEDLWGEAEPQNIPGVSEGYPCWRRPMRVTLEELLADDSIATRVRAWAGRVAERSGAGVS
ncbi:MAG: 4-alpha-glucanotransferase [Phycisphaera sp.]|nr:MAG: 4-alpha-glucanotransferase [Phycisphaera sp.]